MKKLKMLITKLFGIFVIALSLYLIRCGLRWSDSGYGKYLSNITLIGSGLLLLILGVSLILTTKSICELFDLLC